MAHAVGAQHGTDQRIDRPERAGLDGGQIGGREQGPVIVTGNGSNEQAVTELLVVLVGGFAQILNFGDWQLALAAYNWGQGNVQRAVERNLKSGLPATYESLRMPDETRNYVPKLQAVKNIVMTPQAFSITLPAGEVLVSVKGWPALTPSAVMIRVLPLARAL